MCDPLTLALTALSAAGTKSPKPPKAVIPAAPIEDAKAETGADIILGGDRDIDADDELDTKAKKKTTGTGLNSGSNSTGVSIL